MKVDFSPLWDPRSGGKIIDHTLLVDTSGKMWPKRDDLIKAVNEKIAECVSGPGKNRYITIFSYGEELNLHRYMEYIDIVHPIERGEWITSKKTAFYDALIAAIKMAHKRVGAVVNDGKAEIELTVFSEGMENCSISTKEDVQVVLERALNNKGVWEINLGLPQHKNTSIEEFFDLELNLEPRYFDPKDSYYYRDCSNFSVNEGYQRPNDFVDETGFDELEKRLSEYFKIATI